MHAATADVLHLRDRIAVTRVDDVRRAELLRQLELLADHVDGDDAAGAGDRRALDAVEPDAAYAEARTALAQIDSLRSSSDLAAESLRLTLLRYQAGEATALEVVDAQTTLAQARNALDDGLSRYRVAQANVQTLTGSF